MKCLVTGVAGFIGSHLLDELLAQGHEVIGIDNYSAGKKENICHHFFNSNFKFVEMDVRSHYISDLFNGVDVVFHLAACKKRVSDNSPKEDLSINAGGTLSVLLAAQAHGVKRFIYSSTGSVYGEVDGIITEDTKVSPVSFYGVSKLCAENYVQLFKDDMYVIILRYFHVYGTRQNDGEQGGVVARFIKLAREGKELPIYGDGDQVRSFTHVDDIINVNASMAHTFHDSGSIFNCASGIKVSINDTADMVLSYIESKGKGYYDAIMGDIYNFNVESKLKYQWETNFEKRLGELIND